MTTNETLIAQTRTWIRRVVVGEKFCPFAAAPLMQESVHYEVIHSQDTRPILNAVLRECRRLDLHPAIETTLLILPEGFGDFEDFLDLADLAEDLLEDEDYEGIYQIASFHPAYCFADAPDDDAANYTNRSPWPMLHLLREESLDTALERYPDPEAIPERNIAHARSLGLAYMTRLRESCIDTPDTAQT